MLAHLTGIFFSFLKKIPQQFFGAAELSRKFPCAELANSYMSVDYSGEAKILAGEYEIGANGIFMCVCVYVCKCVCVCV